MYFCPVGLRQERRRAWVSGDVLDMDDGQSCVPEFLQKDLRVYRSIFDTDKFHVAAREILILKINQ